MPKEIPSEKTHNVDFQQIVESNQQISTQSNHQKSKELPNRELKKSNNNNRYSKCSPYNWSPYQNKKYVQFLKDYQFLMMLSPKEKMLKKVNLKMSKKIKTRNHIQCRTHHQKMMAKYGSVEEIIKNSHDLYEQKMKPVGEENKDWTSAMNQIIKSASQWKSTDQILASPMLATYAPLMLERQPLDSQDRLCMGNEEEDDLFTWRCE